MKSNTDVDFEISEKDMEFIKKCGKIKDYGDAKNMPVFGGKLNLKSMLSMLFHNKKRKSGSNSETDIKNQG